MKFPVEKKSTLCIYTEPASADKLAGASATASAPASASAGLAAAAEAAGLRRDLEAARGALRRQEARCRVLVAALSARLREREAAARAERLLRDRQLAGVLRALTALEARLRQEQRLIRRQLAERDATIARQADEISILRATHPADEESSTDAAPERFRWPGEEPGGADDLPEHPTRAARPTHPAAFSLHRSARVKAHRVAAPAPATGAAPASAPAPRRESEATLLRFKLSGAPPPPEVDCGALDSDSGVFHGSDGSDSSLRSDEAAAGGAGCCADEEPDDDLPAPARDLSKHYAHNPVLECVSQILLRDRDDAASPLPLPPPPPPQGCASAPGGRRRAPPPPALWPSIREERESLADDAEADAAEAASSPPPPAPPSRSQHLQERACALLTRRLTVVSHPELEQVDDAAQSPPPPPPPPAPASPTPSPPSSASSSARPGAGAPPAVPPKPPQLGALGRLKRRAPARAPGAAPHRQILSNGSLIKAAADRSTSSSSSSSSASSAAGVVAGGAPVASRARGVGPVAARVQRQMESRLPAAPAAAAPAAAAAAAAIRVGSSVSSLITGAAGGSIVCELARDRQPDALHSHFEEFRLEDVDIGDGEDHERSSGDGAAPATPSSTASTPTGAPDTAPASTRDDASTYESFLEATGLSQKSLLTPSRLISNHRSVLKPKDVKLRSRAARASAAPALAAAPDRPAPIVRYWVEPYL